MILNTKVKTRKSDSDDNLIPLINVVFLMLVFFMVAGQITAPDDVAVAPPVSLNESPKMNEQLVIVVTKDGDVFIDQSVIPAEEITQHILSYSVALKPDGSNAILIKADASLEVEKLQLVLKRIKAAGVTRLSLITQKVRV